MDQRSDEATTWPVTTTAAVSTATSCATVGVPARSAARANVNRVARTKISTSTTTRAATTGDCDQAGKHREDEQPPPQRNRAPHADAVHPQQRNEVRGRVGPWGLHRGLHPQLVVRRPPGDRIRENRTRDHREKADHEKYDDHLGPSGPQPLCAVQRSECYPHGQAPVEQ